MTKAKAIPEEKLVERLTNELHSAVEGDQGLAYCSDGVYATSIREFFDFTEAQLFWNREASKKMAAFLRKHKKLRRAYSSQREKNHERSLSKCLGYSFGARAKRR